MVCRGECARAADSRQDHGIWVGWIADSAIGQGGAYTNVGTRNLRRGVGSRPKNEGGGQVVLFVVTGEDVVAETQVQGEPPRDLTIILEIAANLKIPPVPNIAGEVRGTAVGKARIDTCNLFRGSIRRKVPEIEHLERRPGNVELAVFDVALDIRAKLYAVLPLAYGHHVAIGVVVLLEELRVSCIGAKPSCAGIEVRLGHAGILGNNASGVLAIAGSEFVDDRR